MFRFVFGALMGGLAVWYWRDQIREYAEPRTVEVRRRIREYAEPKTMEVRRSAAKVLQSVRKKAEDVWDRRKEHAGSATQAGQDALGSR